MRSASIGTAGRAFDVAGFEELLQMSDGDKTRLIADVTINQKNRNKCAMNKNKENIQVYSNIVVSLVLVYIKLHIKNTLQCWRIDKQKTLAACTKVLLNSWSMQSRNFNIQMRQ